MKNFLIIKMMQKIETNNSKLINTVCHNIRQVRKFTNTLGIATVHTVQGTNEQAAVKLRYTESINRDSK